MVKPSGPGDFPLGISMMTCSSSSMEIVPEITLKAQKSNVKAS
jgi:hypothetical protein